MVVIFTGLAIGMEKCLRKHKIGIYSEPKTEEKTNEGQKDEAEEEEEALKKEEPEEEIKKEEKKEVEAA